MLTLRHSFPSQERNEAVFVFARPYWFAFLPSILIFILVFSGAAAGQAYAATQPGGLSPFTANIIVLGLGIFLLIVLTVFVVAVLDYYFDIIVVTDRRLVDIDQEQLFYRKISELNLRDVQDVSFDRSGFFQTFLNYGSITIQTAGERMNFTLNNLRHPSEIAGIISDLADQAKSDIKPEDRFPETHVIGVIEGELITDPEKLVVVGAMLPEDVRRSHAPH